MKSGNRLIRLKFLKDRITGSSVWNIICNIYYIRTIIIIFVVQNFVRTVYAYSIARWDGSTFSALQMGASVGVVGHVSSLAVMGSDLYAGGDFSTAGSVTASNIARWNGSTFSALQMGTSVGVDGDVSDLAVMGSDVYLSGIFLTAGSVTARYIARWNGSTFS
jgi:hypothetical protein